MKTNICVVGWYLGDEQLDFLDNLSEVTDVVMVSHKEDKKLSKRKFRVVYRPNIGLEFGAYDFYLKHMWDRESNVLFMHDDFEAEGVKAQDFVDKIEEITKGIDQAYIFRDALEEKHNGGKHGRAIYLSMKLLAFILNNYRSSNQSSDHFDTHNPDTVLKGCGPYNGFWYDPENRGHTTGKPPKGVRHYNIGIYTFHSEMGRVRDRKYKNEPMKVVQRVYYGDFKLGRRGIDPRKKNRR